MAMFSTRPSQPQTGYEKMAETIAELRSIIRGKDLALSSLESIIKNGNRKYDYLIEEISDTNKALSQLTDMVLSVMPKEVTIKVDWAEPDSDITVKEEKPKEPTVGDVITLKLRIEETANRSCKGCVFGSGDRCNNICDILGVPCNMDCREDGKDIIFKEV